MSDSFATTLVTFLRTQSCVLKGAKAPRLRCVNYTDSYMIRARTLLGVGDAPDRGNCHHQLLVPLLNPSRGQKQDKCFAPVNCVLTAERSAVTSAAERNRARRRAQVDRCSTNLKKSRNEESRRYRADNYGVVWLVDWYGRKSSLRDNCRVSGVCNRLQKGRDTSSNKLTQYVQWHTWKLLVSYFCTHISILQNHMFKYLVFVIITYLRRKIWQLSDLSILKLVHRDS